MKHAAHLQELILTMSSGSYSRNKHFDAYQRPEVVNARARQLRLTQLIQMLDRADCEGWLFSLEPSTVAGSWILWARSDRLKGSWAACLFDFELEILRKHSLTQVLKTAIS